MQMENRRYSVWVRTGRYVELHRGYGDPERIGSHEIPTYGRTTLRGVRKPYRHRIGQVDQTGKYFSFADKISIISSFLLQGPDQ